MFVEGQNRIVADKLIDKHKQVEIEIILREINL